MGTFPRKVVISPSFGAGIATWMSDDSENRWLPYERVECPAFVAYIEECRANKKQPDHDRVRHIWFAEGLMSGPDEYVYLGGLSDATVVEVPGPYRITEYDGSEAIETATDPWWRH